MAMMAQVSRQSTFPPILKSYNPAITASFHPSGSLQRSRLPTKLSRRADQVHETRSQPQAGPASRPQSKEPRGVKKKLGDEGAPGTIDQQPGSSSGLLTVDKIRREHELELRRKRNQKAEATLMCWDALLEQHQLKKYKKLLQRVGIQRDLISKNDKLANELRRRDEEERIEKIQARRSTQKKLTEALRSHIQRIEEHKKKIAEKMNALKLAKEEQDKDVNIATEQFLSPVHGGLVHGETIPSSDDGYNEQNLQNDNTTVVYQMLGGDDTKQDTKAMLESLWGGKKMAAHQQIRPIIIHSNKLKQVASPSVKQCLELYEQPTVHDRYTGKPIPLGEVLHEIITKAETGTSYSNWNRAIELMNKHLQRRADALLQRRDPYNSLDPALSCNEGWFTENFEGKRDGAAASTSLEKRKRNEKASLLPKRKKSGGTGLEIKRKLPTFLTSDGDLLTGSLEEFGDQLHCSPSKTTKPSANVTSAKDEWEYDGSSVFLTDLHSESIDNINLEQKSTTTLVRELYEKSSPKRTAKLVTMGWQPLSFRALSEHSSVSELPVKGLGHTAHGRYSMWRPEQSCTPGMSE